MVEPPEIRDMIPGITERTLGGLFFAKGGHANTQLAVQAFAWAFQDLGGRLYQHTAVTGFQVVDGRVTAVETTAGPIAADMVVAAAGPQTGLMAGLVGVHIPVAPARVEILATAPIEPLTSIALVGNGLYGHQAVREEICCLAAAPTNGPTWTSPQRPASPTRRSSGISPGGSRSCCRTWRTCRSFAAGPEWWSRPRTIMPIIDILDSPSNYVVVTASAHGFGISPATGKVVSDLVLYGETNIDIGGLGLGRFADVTPDWRHQRGWIPAPNRS